MTTPVVLVTGALTGIGRATALAFAREGARIVISGRHDDEGQKLAAEVRKHGAEGTTGPLTDQTAETYAATFDTNVLGTLLSMKHEMRVMLAQGSGSIINISSTYGHTGAAGASLYSASKHAVEGLTKSAAIEVAPSGVRVNMVAPGPIDTGMLQRFTGTDEKKAGLTATVALNRPG